MPGVSREVARAWPPRRSWEARRMRAVDVRVSILIDWAITSNCVDPESVLHVVFVDLSGRERERERLGEE